MAPFSRSQGKKNAQMPPRIAKSYAKEIVEDLKAWLASDAVMDLRNRAALRSRRVARVDASEIRIGRLLGQGAFSNAYEMKQCPALDAQVEQEAEIEEGYRSEDSVRSGHTSPLSSASTITATAYSCAAGAGASETKKRSGAKSSAARKKYVVKMLRKDVFDDLSALGECAAGLAKESVLMSLLDHPHILKVRALSADGVAGFATGRHDAFCLVLDRLDLTLTDQIEKWKKQAKQRFPIMRRRSTPNELFCERLAAGVQLADAVAYLHRNRIMHRDLKTDNVGFDCASGRLQLFDFDMSRVLPRPETDDDNERYELTMCAGTRRYMSPECFFGLRYNLRSDVFSFAILLHQMLTLETPFADMTQEEHAEMVYRNHQRPELVASWPVDLRDVLKRSWSVDVSRRPDMSEVHVALSGVLLDVSCPDPLIPASAASSASSSARSCAKHKPGKSIKSAPRSIAAAA